MEDSAGREVIMSGRDIRVTKLGRTIGTTGYLDKASYRVVITEGNKKVVVEARVSMGDLEQTNEPEQAIQKWFAARPTPEPNAVIGVDLFPGQSNSRSL